MTRCPCGGWFEDDGDRYYPCESCGARTPAAAIREHQGLTGGITKQPCCNRHEPEHEEDCPMQPHNYVLHPYKVDRRRYPS
jgi:hypothetical protein